MKTIEIYRFYFKCTDCMSEITFKTDPKGHDYVVENGAKRSYEALKDAQQADIAVRELKEAEERGSVMKKLENKAYDAKREEDINDALFDIGQLNKRKLQVRHEQLLEDMLARYGEEVEYDGDGPEEGFRERSSEVKRLEFERKEQERAKEVYEMVNYRGVRLGESTGLESCGGAKKKGLDVGVLVRPRKQLKTEERLRVKEAFVGVDEGKVGKAVNLCEYSDDDSE